MEEASMNVMNPLGSLSSALPAAQARLGSFERHAREYGPVAAGVIGVAQAGASAAETVVEFSAESLERLGRLAGAAVEDVVDGVVEGVESGYDALAGAVGEVIDGIGDVAQGAAGYAALGAAAGKRVFDELA
jgi:hypothetical protein